jgi:5'-3' exonuclease
MPPVPQIRFCFCWIVPREPFGGIGFTTLTRRGVKSYEWLTEKGHRLFRVPELEADDLAYLVKRAIRSVSPLQPMFILTNDNDYIQLCDANCRCFNASLKEIATRGQYGGVANPLAEMRAKILLGDKSDCISACISKKHLEPLLHCDEEALKIQLKPAEYTLYEKNKRLIDLSQIPEELQLRFSAIYSFIV